MTLSLPPLNALRAFEAAARAGSYVGAAEELKVSPAAVSQHIRNLEAYLDKRLFTRLNNRVVLTDAGAEIFGNIHRAFDDIAQSTARAMNTRPRSRLVISSLPSLSERWLVPQLARFAASHAEFRFELRSEEALADLDEAQVDLRLGYGASSSPKLESHFLRQDELLPLAAPSYVSRHRVADDLAAVPDEDLIHTDWGRDFASRPSWQDWCNRFAGARKLRASGHQTSHSSLALDLAARGLGVALGQRMLAAEDVRNGKLVALSPHALPLGHAYHLIYLKAKSHKPMLQPLVQFLQQASAA